MHDDRTGREAATPPAQPQSTAPPRRCWNCGTMPNLRCCEFGRDR